MEPRKYLHEPMKKGWAYYKRTGCIWSDYGRLPRNWLSLVVRPLAVKRDREYTEHLLGKVEQEDDDARQTYRMQLEQRAYCRTHHLEKVSSS